MDNDKDIQKYFTLKNMAKLFYDKSGDDDTIYTNYFKLIENRILTEKEIEGRTRMLTQPKYPKHTLYRQLYLIKIYLIFSIRIIKQYLMFPIKR